MAWISAFKLGPAGAEYTFALNPSRINIPEQPIKDEFRTVDGSLVSIAISPNRPTISIEGNFVEPAQVNFLRHLVRTYRAPLIFEPIDLTGADVWEVIQDQIYPTTTTSAKLNMDSVVRASMLRAAAGAAATISVVGVYTGYSANSRTGTTDKYSSYAASTNILTLSTVNAAAPLYATYQYKAIAVTAKILPVDKQAGMVGSYKYTLEMNGA